MRQQTMVRKDLQSKKVAVFANQRLTIVAAYLKPGDKLKYDDKDTQHYFLDKFGDVPYRKVYVNGQEGYIVAEAIDTTSEVSQNGRNNSNNNKKRH